MANEIKKIVDEASKRGYDVKIRDVSYALLRARFKDERIAYMVVFGTPEQDNDVTVYEAMDSIQFLIRWFEKDLAPKEVIKKSDAEIIKEIKSKNKKQETQDDSGVMTFEENRAGIEAQIEEILELKKQLIGADGKCADVKTMAVLQKTEADLRSKLNDKFGAAEKSKEQYIIVQKKFDHICPHTRRECYQMTKEDAMRIWNLTDKKE